MGKVKEAIMRKQEAIAERLGIDLEKLNESEFNALQGPLWAMAEWMLANPRHGRAQDITYPADCWNCKRGLDEHDGGECPPRDSETQLRGADDR